MFKVAELLKATQGRLISGSLHANAKGISIDSRTIRLGEAFIAIKGSNFDGHNFIDEAIKKGASCIIKEAKDKKYETKSLAFIEVKDTTRALGDIARFQREKFNLPVIAITGSNGKTTTKEMVAWILSKQFKVLKNIGTKNNQIGLPLTLVNLNSSFNLAVLEIGTSHPGEVKYLARIAQPNIGIITNIGPAHLEYFKNLEGVFKEKNTLLKNLKKPGIAILNADDVLLRKKVTRMSAKTIIFGFGIRNKTDFFATDIKVLNTGIEFLVNPYTNCNKTYAKNAIGVVVNKKYRFTPLDGCSKIDKTQRHLTGFTLNTLGYYNIYNALVAIAVARLFGMEYKDIAGRLATFNFPQNRLKLIEFNKIKFINDTYNSNPFSLRQALEALDNFRTKGRKIFIMGDMLELGRREELFHRRVGPKIAQVCDIFITVGRLSKFTAKAARICGFNTKNIFTCESSQQARDILFKEISVRPNDIVLVKGSRAMKMEDIFIETPNPVI